jgi:uncharacterized protein (DUF1499 family)
MRSLPREPVPRFAIIARWLVLGGWGLAFLSIFAVRLGGVPLQNGVAVLATAIMLAALSLVASSAALVTIWRTAAPGLGIIARSLFLAIILLLWPAYLAFTALQFPVIKDITTNLEDPPVFARSRNATDARQGFNPGSFDPRNGVMQQEAYSDISTIVVEQSPEEALALVRRAATNLGWVIIDSANPNGRGGAGRIEAISSTFLFRFPTDITIRIKPGVGDTLIDLRLVSRFGRHDFGRNAEMIRRFAKEIEALPNSR